MQLTLLLQCLLMGLLGQALHLLKVLKDGRRLAAVSNVPFSNKKFFENEWISITISFIALLMLVIGIDEIIHWKPAVLLFVKWFFAPVGFAGDVLVYAFLGRTQSWLLCIIDKKTNIADGKPN